MARFIHSNTTKINTSIQLTPTFTEEDINRKLEINAKYKILHEYIRSIEMRTCNNKR